MVPGDVPGDGQYSTAKLMASLLYSHYNVQTPFFLHGDTVKQKKKKKPVYCQWLNTSLTSDESFKSLFCSLRQ